MPWEFDTKLPIFKQIVDTITLRIIKGEYKSGDKLDSVRDLAVEAGVNPNTMQRALAETETTGLVETKRGDGRYITENAEIIARFRQEYIEKSIADFMEKMNRFGLNKAEIIEIIEKTDI